jgi:hypothetical protein
MMQSMLPTLILAVLLNAAAAWVHAVLPRFSPRRTATSRALLIGTGLGCAVVGSMLAAETPGAAALAAAVGFGVVHVPAAFILALKYWRSRARPRSVRTP